MSGRIEDQVKAEIASRRLHPDDGYSYEECNGPSCRAIRDAAARAAAPPECGAPAVGGPCILPRAHNMGHADIPSNHRAAAPSVPEGWHVTRQIEDADLIERDEPDASASVPPPDRVAGLREAHWPTLVFQDGDGDLVRCDCGEQGFDFKQGREWFAAHIDRQAEATQEAMLAAVQEAHRDAALLAEPVPGLDVERLARAMDTVYDKNPGVMRNVADALAAEYARLSETPDAD